MQMMKESIPQIELKPRKNAWSTIMNVMV